MSRYVRFTLFGKSRWGRVIAPDGDAQLPVSPTIEAFAGDPFEPEAGPSAVTSGEGASNLPWDAVSLNPPVPGRGSKIVAVARNYRAHAAELNNPVPETPLLFLKPASALLADGGDIVLPTGQSELVHHEGELAVIIGRRTRNVSKADALNHVLGYSIINDVTARDLQRADGKFTRGKGFDTFAPIGPWVDTAFTPAGQQLTVRVNGEVRQNAPLTDMIFDVPTLIAFISRIMTLERYDIIATGTPAGVGPLLHGDEVEVTIEGLGTLKNSVVAGPPAPAWEA